VDKKDLQQYRHLKSEIEELKKRIENIECFRYGDIVADSVVGSSTTFPYTQHTIVITGEDTSYDLQVKKLQAELNKRLRGLIYTERKISSFLESIKDSEIRRMINLRYVEGLTWQQIANRIGESDEQYPRKKVKRFMEKQKLDEKDEN